MVLISWVIFYFTDLSRAAQYLGIMFGLSGQPLTNSQTLLALEGNLFWLILAVVFCRRWPGSHRSRSPRQRL